MCVCVYVSSHDRHPLYNAILFLFCIISIYSFFGFVFGLLAVKIIIQYIEKKLEFRVNFCYLKCDIKRNDI